MNAVRSTACALAAIAALVNSGRARAAVEEGAVVRVHVVASPAEARATREVLADLLSRIGIGFADAATTPPFVDVEIDLSTGRGGPSVTLTTREPPVLICRRVLSPQASREVLIESAAEVAYAAVESRARALGAVRESSPVAGPQSDTPAVAPVQPEVAAIVDAGAPALHKQVASPVAMPGYGVDVAAFGEMQLRDVGASHPAAGGGAAVTVGLRGLRLNPALTLGASYLRAVGVDDPAAPANLSMVSTRLGATIAALAFRWISLQLGPSLSLDFVQGDAPVFMSGPGPGMMMPLPGTQSFSGLAVWAGGSARFAVRLTQSAHVFVAAGADYQLRQAGPARAAGAGPPIGVTGMTGQWMDAEPSGWRSSLVVGLGFTLAGRPLMTD